MAREIGARHVMVDDDGADRSALRQQQPPALLLLQDRALHQAPADGRRARTCRRSSTAPTRTMSAISGPACGRRKQLGVRSPLHGRRADQGGDPRTRAGLGLPTWDKPAAACLSSRFAYGDPITVEKLRQVAAAERFLRGLGYPRCSGCATTTRSPGSSCLPRRSPRSSTRREEIVAGVKAAGYALRRDRSRGLPARQHERGAPCASPAARTTASGRCLSWRCATGGVRSRAGRSPPGRGSPRPTCTRCSSALSRAGFVRSTRGPLGGHELAPRSGRGQRLGRDPRTSTGSTGAPTRTSQQGTSTTQSTRPGTNCRSARV